MMIFQQTRGILSSGDGLALDLPFAKTKSLTALVGPTPTFTRASIATYVGPKIEAFGHVLDFDGFMNERVRWYAFFDPMMGHSIAVQYNGTQWELEYALDDILYFYAAAGNEWRPDQADWSGSGINVTTSSTFGIIGAANNEPRFDHDPLTGVCRGLLTEDEVVTNLVFPSDTLTTQTRTVTAVAHTLSFYGTGTVVLSGAHSATVVGTGAFPSLSILTFTPTAGSLTLTVTGTVQFAQLEAGGFATSYIPTMTSALARSVDVCSISGSNFTGMWNATEGTLYAAFYTYRSNQPGGIVSAGRSGTGAGRIEIGTAGTTRASFSIVNDSVVSQFNYTNTSPRPFQKSKAALAYQNNNCIAVANTTNSFLDTSVTLGTQNELRIGRLHSTNKRHSVAIDSIRVYRKRLPFVKLQTLARP